jgi:cytochrome c oxidase assembly protein Cox11
MSPFLRLAIQIIVIVGVLTLAIQPFNWYCQLTQSCRPFFFSYYLPKREGKKEFPVKVEVNNYNENIEFFAEETNIKIPTNRKHVINFHIKNLSKKLIVIRPKLTITPKALSDNFIRYQCLCSQQIKLKGGEEVIAKMEFEIDKKFEDTEFFRRREFRNDKDNKKIENIELFIKSLGPVTNDYDDEIMIRVKI